MIAPLQGRRILDLGALCAQEPHGLAAALATKLCRQYGAIVVRPLPVGGEPLARHAPLLPDGSSALDRFLNRGKSSGDTTGVFDAAVGTGLLAALRAEGEEVVDISLLDVNAWLNWKVAAGTIVLGTAPSRGGDRADWFTVAARDGHVALVYQDKDWPALRDLIGDPALADTRFATRAGRRVNRAALLERLAPWFAARQRSEITAAAQAKRIPIGPVLYPQELLADAQNQARGFLGADGMPTLPLSWDGVRLQGGEETYGG